MKRNFIANKYVSRKLKMGSDNSTSACGYCHKSLLYSIEYHFSFYNSCTSVFLDERWVPNSGVIYMNKNISICKKQHQYIHKIKTKEQICGQRTATCNKHYTNLFGLFCFALILVVIQ